MPWFPQAHEKVVVHVHFTERQAHEIWRELHEFNHTRGDNLMLALEIEPAVQSKTDE